MQRATDYAQLSTQNTAARATANITQLQVRLAKGMSAFGGLEPGQAAGVAREMMKFDTYSAGRRLREGITLATIGTRLSGAELLGDQAQMNYNRIMDVGTRDIVVYVPSHRRAQIGIDHPAELATLLRLSMERRVRGVWLVSLSPSMTEPKITEAYSRLATGWTSVQLPGREIDGKLRRPVTQLDLSGLPVNVAEGVDEGIARLYGEATSGMDDYTPIAEAGTPFSGRGRTPGPRTVRKTKRAPVEKPPVGRQLDFGGKRPRPSPRDRGKGRKRSKYSRTPTGKE